VNLCWFLFSGTVTFFLREMDGPSTNFSWLYLKVLISLAHTDTYVGSKRPYFHRSMSKVYTVLFLTKGNDRTKIISFS
jgi:hypothetical protein